MTYRVALTELANSDLRGIYEYIFSILFFTGQNYFKASVRLYQR